MILKLPTGSMRAPVYMLVDTTATAFDPDPNVWRVNAFYREGAAIELDGRTVHLRFDDVDRYAASAKLDPAMLRTLIGEAVEASRETWRRDAVQGMDRDYHNTRILLPGGDSLRTHATVEDIAQAMLGTGGVALVVVNHTYPALPDFDERGLPQRDEPDDCPF